MTMLVYGILLYIRVDRQMRKLVELVCSPLVLRQLQPNNVTVSLLQWIRKISHKATPITSGLLRDYPHDKKKGNNALTACEGGSPSCPAPCTTDVYDQDREQDQPLTRTRTLTFTAQSPLRCARATIPLGPRSRHITLQELEVLPALLTPIDLKAIEQGGRGGRRRPPL